MRKYSGIGLFKHCYKDPHRINKFEERVVLTRADSREIAEQQILSEFNEYAVDETIFLGEFTISEILEQGLVTEVGSVMRVFEGQDEEYIDKYWVSGHPDTCDQNGWRHVWYKKDRGISACYNCKEEREGELWKTA